MLTVDDDDDDFGVWCAAGVEQLRRRRRSSRMWCWTRRNMLLAEAEVYNGAVIIHPHSRHYSGRSETGECSPHVSTGINNC